MLLPLYSHRPLTAKIGRLSEGESE